MLLNFACITGSDYIQMVIMIQCYFIYEQVFWKIMFSYRQVKEWHSKSDTLSDVGDNADTAFDRSYVKTKLENGLLRVWRVRMFKD